MYFNFIYFILILDTNVNALYSVKIESFRQTINNETFQYISKNVL